jgi:hypothetical protein
MKCQESTVSILQKLLYVSDDMWYLLAFYRNYRVAHEMIQYLIY